MKPPCYKCQNRELPTETSNGCKAYCEKWLEYEKEKFNNYHTHRKIQEQEINVVEYLREKKDRLKKE